MVSQKTLAGFAYTDTGSVANSFNYTTVFLVHGFGFYSTNFQHTTPFVAKGNARLVVINRRDFPGSKAYSGDDISLLKSIQRRPEGEGRKILDAFMRERALEIYSFISAFIKQESIPEINVQSGGIILAAWSFGVTWVMSLLAHAKSFPVKDVDLIQYVQRVVFYDPPCHAFGYPLPEDPYSPLLDEAVDPQDRPRLFSEWVSGYFSHDLVNNRLERRKAALDVTPTITRMTLDEIQACFHADAAGEQGSDTLHFGLGISTGLNAHLRRRVFFHDGIDGDLDNWDKVPIRYLWCKRSEWEMAWGAERLRTEIHETSDTKRHIRLVGIEGSNHFMHWDEPSRFVQYLLGTDEE